MLVARGFIPVVMMEFFLHVGSKRFYSCSDDGVFPSCW